MTAQEVKNRLTDDDICKLLLALGATLYQEDDEFMVFDTICHHGSRPKLYYYRDGKNFFCYTECDSLDILGVICNNKGYNLFEAINWVVVQLNLDSHTYGFGNTEVISDWDFINSFKRSQRPKTVEKELVPYDESIMNIFQPWYCQDWIDDGISVDSMIKYNIKYSTLQQKIIIPHYDITNRLIGIRYRALLEEDIDRFGKYSPFQLHNKMYNHPLSLNFYGINHNLKTIKKKQKVMLVEGEKGVLQTDTMFGEDNFTLGLCGKKLSIYQRNLLIMLGVKEVIIALDRQYENLDSDEAIKWAKHIKDKIVKILAPYVSVYVIWDTENLLGYKDSPTDRGKDTLLKLMKNKIFVTSME